MEYKTTVINLFGGPGTGKSLMMADLFAHFKRLGITVEMAPEFAKEVIWQETTPRILNNQIHVFGVQHNRIHRLLGQVEVVVTDAPLINSVLYDPEGNHDFHKLVLTEHHKLNNLNFLVKRLKKFEGGTGRIHDEHKSLDLDAKIKKILEENLSAGYSEITAEEKYLDIIHQTLIKTY